MINNPGKEMANNPGTKDHFKRCGFILKPYCACVSC